MKKILFSLLIISNAWAQDYSDLLSFRGASLGSSPAQQIAKTQEILNEVYKVALAQGTHTEIVRLTDNMGNSYPAMVVKTNPGSPLNKEAARIAGHMPGLPLVFSPYDLGRSGSSAFFDPSGKMLGVSYDFILGNPQDTSYTHELYHSSNYQKVLTGKPTIWAGVLKVMSGQYLSATNSNYYYRFASLDELPATALSLKIDTAKLLELKRTQSPQAFTNSHGEAARILGEIHLSIQAGMALAMQSRDLMARALKTQAKTLTIPLKLGSRSANLPTSSYLMESYSWEIVSGRGQMVAIKDGAEVLLYWSRKPSAAELSNRVKEIARRSMQAEAAFKAAEACVYVAIEYPDLSRSNLKCLGDQSGKAFAALDVI